MYNHRKLIGRIVEKYETQGKFAKVLFNDNESSKILLSLKINNKRCFNFKEIVKMIKLLDIPKEEIYDYFFKEL